MANDEFDSVLFVGKVGARQWGGEESVKRRLDFVQECRSQTIFTFLEIKRCLPQFRECGEGKPVLRHFLRE